MHQFIKYRSLLLLCLIFLLNGCSLLNPKQPNVSNIDKEKYWAVQQNNLLQLTQWQLSAKIGLRLPDDTMSARVNWIEKLDSYDIYLSGPLGKSLAHIKGNSQGVYLKLPKQESLYANSAEYLLRDYFGWVLPVSELYYWIRGIPSTNHTYIKTLDTNGQLKELQQLGWTIKYSSYQGVKNYNLPEKLTLTQQDVRLVIVIKQWDI